MTRLERELKRLEPRAPSDEYYVTGIARIAAHARHAHAPDRRWRLATMALGALLAVSIGSNLLLWRQARSAAQAVVSGERNTYLVSSTLTMRGDELVLEGRNGLVDEGNADD